MDELSRPGVALDETMMGGWVVPETVAEPPIEYRHQLEFVASDGTHLRGEFWARPTRNNRRHLPRLSCEP